MFNFTQLINKPTRVTPTSKSANDLIFVSDLQKVCQSGVVTFGVSDHFLTYCTKKNTKQVFNKHKTIKIRSMKKFTTEKFQSMLSNVEWDDVFNCENVEKAWNIFKRFLLSVIDEIAPIKQIRVKQRTEPWFSAEIKDLIHDRDKALHTFRKTKNSGYYSDYKMLRKKVQYEIKKAKTQYYKDKIEDN